MENSNEGHELLSISKAARYLNTSASTIRRWDDHGKIKSVRHPMNNYRMYRVKDLDAILNRLKDI